MKNLDRTRKFAYSALMHKDTYGPQDLIPIGEAARVLGVSVDTVRRWDGEGRLDSYRTAGGQRRFRRGDVEALLNAERAS